MNNLAKAKRLELIDMLQAESEGKEIESRVRYTEDDNWSKCYDVLSEIVFNWFRWDDGKLEFRLKPEPDRVQLCERCGVFPVTNTKAHREYCQGKVYLFYLADAISVT